MKLLILGGGRFVGAAVLDAARQRGHAVTVFNRGRARTTWPAGTTVVAGDRDTDLAALAAASWDGVIDTCGYLPRQLRASCTALGDCGRYLFVSSVSVYASFERAPVREDDPLADPAGVDPEDRRVEAYGAQKAACEAVVTAAFGDRALIVRPGYIVGPGDISGRFSHWPWRCAEGGEMLVPDAPADAPVQWIDVRDLAAWMVRLLENGAAGPFNAVGPQDGTTTGWPGVFAACTAAVHQSGLAPARQIPVSERFLSDRGLAESGELPIWVPSGDPAYAGFNHVDGRRARDTGLQTRPLADTLADILAEGVPPPDDARRRGKLTHAKEAALLREYRAEV
ncbi:MAG: NAD-dependent epimerase/dehydratase family protein [Piscinibacter sp.]|nr:NAD-dependent epimerase/dehydratase family protein [Piscinibacter sp.]